MVTKQYLPIRQVSAVLSVSTGLLAALHFPFSLSAESIPGFFLIGAASVFLGLATVVPTRLGATLIPIVGTFALIGLAGAAGGLFSDAMPWIPFIPLVAVVVGRAGLAFPLTVWQIATLSVLAYLHVRGVLAPMADYKVVALRMGAVTSATAFSYFLARTVNRSVVREQSKLRRDAFYDELTGLMNRKGLTEHLADFSEDRQLSFFYLDIDGLKAVNDSYGHQVGDTLLKEVGLRLKQKTRAEDLCVRMGGDEFLLVLSGEHNHAVLQRRAEELCKVLAEPLDVNGTSCVISASIGIATTDEKGCALESSLALIDAADQTMYGVKKRGGNAYGFYGREKMISGPSKSAE